jgi:hypothetical protein
VHLHQTPILHVLHVLLLVPPWLLPVKKGMTSFQLSLKLKCCQKRTLQRAVFLPVVARPAAVAASGAPFAETLAVVGVG